MQRKKVMERSVEAAITGSPFQGLHDYWRDRTDRSGVMPHGRLDASELPAHLLPDIYLVELDGTSSRLRYRLAGTAIDRIEGTPLTGRYLHEVHAGGTLLELDKVYRSCMEDRMPLLRQSILGSRLNPAASYCLALPMRRGSSDCDMVLGAWMRR